MSRPVLVAATVASIALLAGPAWAQMRTSASTGGGGDQAITWGGYAGFETDNSLGAWGPAVGLNLHWDMGGPMNVVAMPRFTYGIGYPSAIKVPVTLRKEIPDQAGVYAGFGPYFGYSLGGGGTATASAAMDVGALVEAGISMPMTGMTLEIGGEAGYGFLNPAKAGLPWTAMVKIGGRM